MKLALDMLLGIKGDLILISLSTLFGFLLCCFWVINLKDKIKSYKVMYEDALSLIDDWAWKTIKAESKLPVRDGKGRFVSKKGSELVRS